MPEKAAVCLAGWLVLAALAGCAFVAEHAAAPKIAAALRSEDALRADALFWQTFHEGDYAHIAASLEAETAAYLAHPDDAVTAAHVAWLHLWRVAERRRSTALAATVTDDLTLARRYFQEAVALNPDDARYLGFLAGTTVAEATVHHDERLRRHGYFMLEDAIRAYPEFNLFTAGYVMSGLPARSAGFRQALEWQWRNLDACAGEKVDRVHPDYSRYLSLEVHAGPRRVCWNSPIAPHNFEGFFLNMGDMLVKTGDWQTAMAVYANARRSPAYSSWSYRQVLEDRIRDAPGNVERFNATNAGRALPMMFASAFACTACHQHSGPPHTVGRPPSTVAPGAP